MRDISILASPIPDHAFFEQAVLQAQLRHQLFQALRLAAQPVDLVARRLTLGVSGQALLAGFQEFLRPAVIKALGEALTAA